MAEASSRGPELLSRADEKSFRELQSKELQMVRDIFSSAGVRINDSLLVQQFQRIRSNQGIDWKAIEVVIGDNEDLKISLAKAAPTYQIFRASQEADDLSSGFNDRIAGAL